MKATVSKLGDAIDVLSGFAYEAELFNETEGLPVIRIRDVVRGFSNTRYSGGVDARFIVKNGEILIGMDGNFNTARWTGGPALLNQRVCKVTARTDILDEGFLFHLLPKELKKIEDTTAFVTVKHLSVKGIRDIDIALPSLPEQRRIAAILDQADALRVKRREALAQLDSLTQSIFIEMFRDALTSNSCVPLSHHIEEFRYGTSNKSGADGYPALRIPNVTSGSLNLKELKTVEVDDAEFQRLKLRDGDLLFVRTNGNPDNVGRCAVFNSRDVSDSGFDAYEFIYASYLIRARIKSGAVRPVVLQQYLSFGEGRQALRARSKTSAGQFNINTEGLGTLPIPIFSMPLQDRFIVRKKAIEQQQTIQRSSLIELDTLFASLQHRAFQGEL